MALLLLISSFDSIELSSENEKMHQYEARKLAYSKPSHYDCHVLIVFTNEVLLSLDFHI